MSDLECERNDKDILDNCMAIINAETKPLKKKPSNKALICKNIRTKHDTMEIERLSVASAASELMELGKDFD